MTLTRADVEFQRAAIRLKAADAALVPLVRRNIRAATADVPAKVRESAVEMLPHGGGLNEWVASSQISTRTSFVPKTAGVTIRMSNKSAAVQAKRARARAAGKNYGGSASHDLVHINRGMVRHPLFGNRDHWYTTYVPKGFFDKPIAQATPTVAAACMAALREAAAIAGYK